MGKQRELHTELLQAALIGYQHELAEIAERVAEINRELGDKPGRRNAVGGRAKWVVSAAVRLKMAAAQQKRWASVQKASGGPAKKVPSEGRRNMSAAGRARIAEATRKRWAAYRAEKAAKA